MADRISVDVLLSLNCTDLYKRGEGATNPDSNFQILSPVCRSQFLNYSQEMAVASSESDKVLL